MPRRLVITASLVASVWLFSPAGTRPPSVEELFLPGTLGVGEATTVGLMRGADAAVSPDQPLTAPEASDPAGGDVPPVRMVVDPYPSFNGVAVDPTNDLVMMSDTNRKSLLLYRRTAGSA